MNRSIRAGILLLILCVARIETAHAAAVRALPAPPVALLRVTFDAPGDRDRLLALNLDVLRVRDSRGADLLAWPGTLETLRHGGFDFEVVHADYGQALAREAGVTPKAATNLISVPPFGSGSMGGYYTLAEVNTWLDDFVATDPNGIVSAVVQIGTSRQGRPIRAVRIAKESLPDHSRPRVLYTSLTHAREPGGMQALLYYMDKLKSLYGVDPDLTYLVDQREMWFVPVMNPDGYAINEATFFGSGSFGMWRKNARDNNGNLVVDPNEGVDINRNFGFQWGFDNIGSSGTPSSQTYRGTSGFSEPETQAIRDFCILHGFRTAENYHTFSELCLYPWGYSGTDTPDSGYYIRLADDMMRDPKYSYGVPADILYSVNGDANDWMYGEQAAKPKVFAVTTEVGDQNDNFWPPAARILPLADSQFRANTVLAYAAGIYVSAESATLVSDDGFLHPNGDAEIAITLRHSGIDASTGGLTVHATTAATGITITDPTSTFASMSPGTTALAGADLIGVSADATVPEGTRVPLELTITDTGSYVRHDVVMVTVGQPITVFNDAGSSLANWTVTPGTWGIQSVGGDPMFSDSPAGDYSGGENASLALTAPLNLTGGSAAFLHFDTQWDLEGGYDFARVEISTNGGGSWTALPGIHTRVAHGTSGAYNGGTQNAGTVGYDANQRFFVGEVVDLSAYAGLSNVRLRFRLTSDFGTERDGWYVDDVRVLVYPQDTTDAGDPSATHDRLAVAAASANPFRDRVRLVATFPATSAFRAAVFTVDGRLVRLLATGMAAAGPHELVWDGKTASGSEAPSGTYLVRIETAAGSAVHRVVRLR